MIPRPASREAASEALILAIETSCDETAVAIARTNGEILASEISSQIDLHQPYGGVVPELASRNHNLTLRPLIDHTLRSAGLGIGEIDAIAATAGPGLASSLLIGNTTAKALALALGTPFYAINHLEGHLLSPFIGNGSADLPSNLSLIVSGGHTLVVHLRGPSDYSVLGSTKDDAAGEAFDKVGKMLGLPYPGGPEIDRRAREGDPAAFDFPRSMIDSGDFQFSFSGLKTSVFYQLKKLPETLDESTINDLCASFQEAVIEVLVTKTVAAARQTGPDISISSASPAISGGLSDSAARHPASLVAAYPGTSRSRHTGSALIRQRVRIASNMVTPLCLYSPSLSLQETVIHANFGMTSRERVIMLRCRLIHGRRRNHGRKSSAARGAHGIISLRGSGRRNRQEPAQRQRDVGHATRGRRGHCRDP